MRPNIMRGFTFVELVIVVVVLGIVAVSVAPRFIGPSGFSESTYQARLITALRHMQQRAMQDTRAGFCHQLIIDTTTPAFGTPTLSYAPGSATSDSCQTSIDYGGPDYLRTDVTELVTDGIGLSSTGLPGYVGFNTLGQAVDNNQARICLSGCQIRIGTKRVCIEREGYIHAC